MPPVDLVRRFYAAFAANDPDTFDEILATDWNLKPPLFGTPGDVEGEKQTVAYLHSVLGNITYAVEDIYDTGAGVVACRNTLRAVTTGPFLGIDTPGRPVELMTMEHHHVAGERIVLTWHLEDFFGVYQSLQSRRPES